MASQPKGRTGKSTPARVSEQGLSKSTEAPRSHVKRAVTKHVEAKAAVTRADAKSSSRKASVKEAAAPAPAKSIDKPHQDNGNGHGTIDAVAEQSAREVFETLTRWRGEVATAAEAMAETCARDATAGNAQFTALLASQREMLEQVKATLTQFQELIETCEHQLEAQAKAAPSESKGGGSSALPLEMPLQALQSFQQLALSNIGTWTKVAQNCQGLWLGAMQVWMPGKGAAPAGAAASEPKTKD